MNARMGLVLHTLSAQFPGFDDKPKFGFVPVIYNLSHAIGSVEGERENWVKACKSSLKLTK
jgi:hypothetical protein